MAFREMRRTKQALPADEIQAILENGRECIVGLVGDDGYPYAVPVNYLFADGKLYFHSANTGHKIDAIRACDKVCVTVVNKADVYAEKLSTNYESVIVFGRARLVESREEMIDVTIKLGMKYSSDRAHVEEEAHGPNRTLAVIEITPEHITGKEGLHLHRARQQKETAETE